MERLEGAINKKQKAVLRTNYVSSEILNSLSFFQDIRQQLSDEKFNQLVYEAHCEELTKFSRVFSYGDMGRKFYIIAKGSVFVLVPDTQNKLEEIQKDQFKQYQIEVSDKENFQKMLSESGSSMRVVAVLPENKTFGEVALHSNVPRTATIVCREDCTLISINIDVYNSIVGKKTDFQTLTQRFNFIDKYHQELYEKNIKFLHSFPFLKGWTDSQVMNLFRNVKEMTCASSQIIYQISDPADKIFFIKQGEFEIQSNYVQSEDHDGGRGNPQEAHLFQKKIIKNNLQRTALLGFNNSFGTEEIVLNLQKRVNKVICVSSKGLLYVVEKTAFFNAMLNKELVKDLSEENNTKQNWRQKMYEEKQQIRNIFSCPNYQTSSPLKRNLATIGEGEEEREEKTNEIYQKIVAQRKRDSRQQTSFDFSSKILEFIQKEIEVNIENNGLAKSYEKFHIKNIDQHRKSQRDSISSFRIQNDKLNHKRASITSNADSIQSLGSSNNQRYSCDNIQKFKYQVQTSYSPLNLLKNNFTTINDSSPQAKEPKGEQEQVVYQNNSKPLPFRSPSPLLNKSRSNKTIQLDFQSHHIPNFNQNIGGVSSANTSLLQTSLYGKNSLHQSSHPLKNENIQSVTQRTLQIQNQNRVMPSLKEAQINERPLLDCFVNALLKKKMIINQSVKLADIQAFTQKEFFAKIRRHEEKKRFCSLKEEGKDNIKQPKQKENHLRKSENMFDQKHCQPKDEGKETLKQPKQYENHIKRSENMLDPSPKVEFQQKKQPASFLQIMNFNHPTIRSLAQTSNTSNRSQYGKQRPQQNNQRREIGDEAVWTLSSAKPGNGVDQLRDGDDKTFWQSDGNQPHLINIQFLNKMRVQEVAIFLDFKIDESYTPSKISIRAGTNLQDLKEVIYVELNEPSGWYIFPMKTKLLDESERAYTLTMNLQIAIIQNQHSGKDTHIRQVLVFGPKEKQNQGLGFPDFKSPEITQYYAIR